MAMEWTYALQLRSKNSAGTVQHTFAPTVRPIQVGPPSYELVQDEFEYIDLDVVPIIRGWRPHLVLIFEVVDGHIAGSPDNLEVVLSDLVTLGNYLEVTLNGANWTVVHLASGASYEPTMPGGKTNAMHLEIEVVGKELVTTLRAPDAARL